MDIDEMLDWTERAAKDIHTRGEELHPVLWLSWGGQLHGLFLATGEHPVDVAALVLKFIGDAFDYDWIGLTVEAWIKKMDVHEGERSPDPENWPRGYLQERADADPGIRTALLTMVINARDFADTKVRNAVAHGDPSNPDWQVDTFEGLTQGWMHEGLTGAIEYARAHTKPPPVGIEQWVTVLGAFGLITAALIELGSGGAGHGPA